MSIIKAVKSHPEVFGAEQIDYTYEEAVRLIAASKSQGSDIHKAKFLILDSYTAMSKLFYLGLRIPAVELAEDLLGTAVQYQCFHIAAETCKYLSSHYKVYQDQETYLKYAALYENYNAVNYGEFQARQVLESVVYNMSHGIEVDAESVKKAMISIGDQLELESINYSNYYYQCMYHITEGTERERILETAISFFENQYFKHSAPLNIFKALLADFTITKNNDLDRADSLLADLILSSNEGGTTWYNYMQLTVEVSIKKKNIKKARKLYEIATNHASYESLSDDDKNEWVVIGEMLKQGEKVGATIV